MAVSRVLLDIGGVLTVDPWESLLLTPKSGLADRLNLDRETVALAAGELWAVHARSHTNESDYWRQLSQRIGAPVPASAVAEAEAELLVVLPGALSALELLTRTRLPWGLISNNTAFWYEKQLAILGLSTAELSWSYTSFAVGREKCDAAGLFDVAAEQVDPPTTLVVDDRAENVDRARGVGFVARLFPESDDDSLPRALFQEVDPDVLPHD